MFTVLCCADLHGEKVNLEVTLDVAPVSVQDLVGSLTHVFACEEAALLTRQGYAAMVPPTFQIISVFIYDDVLLHWTKLKSITQLHEYDQLYVFQPQTQWHHDVQQDLPPPRPPVQSRAASLAASGVGAHTSLPLSSSSYVDQTPLRGVGQPHAAPAPSVSLHSGPTHPRRTPASDPTTGAAAATSTSGTSRLAARSPVRSQLEEQLREEERLSQRLSSVRSERERLEWAAQREEEEERRRRAVELGQLMQRKEQEIWAHRDALAKAEAEFQRLLAEKQQLVRSMSPQ